jgi:subfamily B ATP-binding cassette protein MsbA
MAIALTATVFSAGLSLVFPVVIQQVVDSVFEEHNRELLNQVTLFLIIVFLLRAFSTFIETYTVKWIGERLVADLRSDLYAHLQMMSMKFFTEHRVGELVSRISSDVTLMRSSLVNNLNWFLQQSLVIVGSVTIMILLNWRLTIFMLLLIPIIVVIASVFGFYLRRISTQVQDELAGSTIIVEEGFQGIREVKSFVREPFEIERYNTALWKVLKVAVHMQRTRAIVTAIISFVGFSSLAAILWYGGREVLEGRLTSGELVAFLVYGLTVAGSFASLINIYTEFQEAIGATRKVFQIIDTAPDISDKSNATILHQVHGKISFQDVTFSYDDKQDVLKSINLEIASGEILALVGPSGAGKTTILNLIPRFYDPTSGNVLIDGFNLRDVTQASLRNQIGIVPQETLLFGGTIWANIHYGRLDATDNEIIEAAKAANAHEFIVELTDGYQTIVGERGIRLSGGQRQRVAIARAILKNPRILLLDEATSSLDNESEHLVQEALGRLMQNRTTVIIAHRLSTVRIANRVAVIDKGEIVELGNHDDLMAMDGLYAKLYSMQFREQDLFAAQGFD